MSIEDEIATINSPQTIRERCQELYDLGLKNQLHHFKIHEDQLNAVAEFVLEVTCENYPDGKIPYHSRWTHFNVGGVDRVQWLRRHACEGRRDELSMARMFYCLVVPSILVDAGAGMKWAYRDSNGNEYRKSEGLAVASFDMFAEGLFSSDPRCSMQTDSVALERLQIDVLANGMQVTKDNPIVGLDGRLLLLRNLGRALRNEAYFGGPAAGTVGAMVDYLLNTFGAERIKATDVFQTVLLALGSIWPGRSTIHGINLGDVWKHPLVGGDGDLKNLIPFHKLSQWMTYSLLEPLEWVGVKITHIEELTGLPEYRNGGLFIDMGVLEPLRTDALAKDYLPSDELIVEWRALTVVLLDKLADQIRRKLGKSPSDLPLARILQGGTWAAGRKIAALKRKDGGSPVKIKSDGTVF